MIPNPDAIPVGHYWFEILLFVTFLIHLILMNFILGGSLIATGRILANKEIAKPSLSIPTLIALTINFGVPPLLFVQVLYGHLFYTSSIMMAIPWILVIPVLIMAYYGAYLYVYRINKIKKWLGKTGLLVSTVLLMVIAFLYVNNISLMQMPEKWNAYFEHTNGTYIDFREPTLFPRYLHFVVGAIAVAGLGSAAFYFYSKRSPADEKKEGIEKGLRIFSIATIIQIVVGILFLITLPKDIMLLFMGDNWFYTAVLLIGVLLALAVLHSGFKGNFKPTFTLLIALLFFMVLTRHLLRKAYLNDIFSTDQLTLESQAWPFVAFIFVLLLGVVTIVYMLRLVVKSINS